MVPDNENEELNVESDNFIDNETNFTDQEPSNYRNLLTYEEAPPKNVTLSYEEAIKLNQDDEFYKCSDSENFVKESPPKREFDEFKGWNERIVKFNESLKQISENSINSFFNAAIWGTYFKLEGKKATFEGDLQRCFGRVFLGKCYDLKNELVLDNILQEEAIKLNQDDEFCLKKTCSSGFTSCVKSLDMYSKKITKKMR